MSENKQWYCPSCGVSRFYKNGDKCRNCGNEWLPQQAPVTVRITQCTGSNQKWYKNVVGMEFGVDNAGGNYDYVVWADMMKGNNASWRHIPKADCEVVSPSLPKQEGMACEECEMPDPVHSPFCSRQEPHRPVQEIPEEIMDWIKEWCTNSYVPSYGNKYSIAGRIAIAMYRKMQEEQNRDVSAIEKLYDAQIEALQKELAEVYKKIDDLHDWHLSHLK